MLVQSKAGTATDVSGAEEGAEVPFVVGLAPLSFPADVAAAPPAWKDQSSRSGHQLSWPR